MINTGQPEALTYQTMGTWSPTAQQCAAKASQRNVKINVKIIVTGNLPGGVTLTLLRQRLQNIINRCLKHNLNKTQQEKSHMYQPQHWYRSNLFFIVSVSRSCVILSSSGVGCTARFGESGFIKRTLHEKGDVVTSKHIRVQRRLSICCLETWLAVSCPWGGHLGMGVPGHTQASHLPYTPAYPEEVQRTDLKDNKKTEGGSQVTFLKSRKLKQFPLESRSYDCTDRERPSI